MNKYFWLLTCFFAFIISDLVYSQDGMHPFVQSENAGSMLFEFGPVVLPQATNDLLPMLRIRRGLSEYRSVSVKTGYDGDALYFGTDLRNVFVPDIDQLQIEAAAGLQWFNDPGLKVAGIVSYQVLPFYVYGGLDFYLWATRPGLKGMLLIPAGVAIPLISNKLQFLFEAGIPVSSSASSLQSVTFSLTYKL